MKKSLVAILSAFAAFLVSACQEPSLESLATTATPEGAPVGQGDHVR